MAESMLNPSTSGNSGNGATNTNASTNSRKHQITILDKLRVLDRIDHGESGHEIAKELGVGRSTITYWKHQRKKLEEYVQEKGYQGMRALKLSRIAGEMPMVNGRVGGGEVGATSHLRSQMGYFQLSGPSQWSNSNNSGRMEHQLREEQNGDDQQYGGRYDESSEHHYQIDENSDDDQSILECKLEIEDSIEEQNSSNHHHHHNNESRESIPPPSRQPLMVENHSRETSSQAQQSSTSSSMTKVIVANTNSSRIVRSAATSRSSESVGSAGGESNYELDYTSLTNHTDGIRLLTNAMSYCQKFQEFSPDDLMFFTKWIKLAADKSVEDTLRQSSTSSSSRLVVKLGNSNSHQPSTSN